MSEPCAPAEKDSLIGELFELTPTRVTALTKAIWSAGDPEDFVEMGIRSICPDHHFTRRSEAIAALLKCHPKTGGRISKAETKHAETWPLQIAGFLPFLTVDGLAAYICTATGIDDAAARTMIRSALGSERVR